MELNTKNVKMPKSQAFNFMVTTIGTKYKNIKFSWNQSCFVHALFASMHFLNCMRLRSIILDPRII